MLKEKQLEPRQYQGVMVSSTFTDLVQHRAALISAINSQDFHEVAMENSSAKVVDVIESSLQMVRDCSAYIGVISYKYGQTPPCARRNPDVISITELEFNEALRLGRPILLFVMGDKHSVLPADVEPDQSKRAKLNAFRERAKEMGPDATVHRIYSTFNSLEEFSRMAIQAAAELRRYFDGKDTATQLQHTASAAIEAKPDPIPIPPAFYAEPPYIGSHKFVGRQAQLDTLSDWANPADSHPVLLFEAIGGTGKSILTWEWTTKHSSKVRADWAGQFWYSFYEKGATMVDFCRRALAYMTRQPRSIFKEKNTAELTELLIHQLQAKPWLFILDGLERVLVSYHRIDAAQLRDDEAGITDKIAHRDPCAAINPEDDDLLRALAGASPSKLLITTRLIPRVLLNRSNQPIPGVLRELLPGLRPVDAEALIRACGITGESLAIQSYLKSHCDCHPLVIGVLAGLINDYLPDRGNFDAWAADPNGGGQLNLANLDLVQKRNHILNSALAALPDASRQLLATLALLSESVDYQTLCALNPKLSPFPEETPRPKKIKQDAAWRKLSDAEQKKVQDDYLDAVRRREEYERAPKKREEEIRLKAPELAAIVKDLEHRGLLQYDGVSKRYDLHPVVRGISAGGLKNEEKDRYGRRVVDHFSQQAQDPYDQAETLDEFDNARHIVKALFQMGKISEAHKFIAKNNSFLQALNSRFEAHNEILTIVRPFFPDGWNVMPEYLKREGGVALARIASVALRRIGTLQESYEVSEAALCTLIKRGYISNLCPQLLNIASTVGDQNYLAFEDRLLDLANDFAVLVGSERDLEGYWLARFRQLSKLGKWQDALSAWAHLSKDKLSSGTRAVAAHHYAVHLFQCGKLTNVELTEAEELNRLEKSALGIRNLCALRGFWYLEQEDFSLAKKSLQTAVALANKVGKIDRRSEICLAIAKYNLDELHDPNLFAEQFTYGLDDSCHHALAKLWFTIGDYEHARNHAVAAYRWAWADGKPYSRFNEIEKISFLLEKLDVEFPNLPTYDVVNNENRPWEEDVGEIIRKLQNIYKH